MILKYLIQKELRQISHNKFLPKLIIMIPIMMMLVMPWVTNMSVKNINISIVNNDNSSLSSRLLNRITASHYFNLVSVENSYQNALSKIERTESNLILVIPQNYEQDFISGKTPQVLISANAVNGVKGGLGASYLDNIVNQNLQESLPSPSKAKISILPLFNPYKDYKVFMIPALISVVIILLCGFLT